MKYFIKTLFFSLFAITTYSQQATEIDSKSVKLPRYSDQLAVTNALPSPTQGMLIFRLDTKSIWYYDGFGWKDMAVSSVSVPSPLYLTSNTTTIAGETNQTDEAGVMGINTTDGVSYGVLGRASHIESLDGGAGVKGENMSANGAGFGVQGYHAGTGWAGYFEGYNALKTQGNTYLNGDVSIGNSNAPNPEAILDINSTTKGLLIPRMTTLQRGLISSNNTPTPDGLIVYDTNTKSIWHFDNLNGWIEDLSTQKMFGFEHITTAANVSGNSTTLSYIGAYPTDLVFVQKSLPYTGSSVLTWWDSTIVRWKISNENISNMPVGAKFWVFVIKTN